MLEPQLAPVALMHACSSCAWLQPYITRERKFQHGFRPAVELLIHDNNLEMGCEIEV